MNDGAYYPGLEGVIAGETAISAIEDGLHYRGYTIEALADAGSFERVAWLLLRGELPSDSELSDFRERVQRAAKLPAALQTLLESLPTATNGMDVLRTGTSVLAHWDPDVANNGREANLAKAERLLGQLPIVMAAYHRIQQGLAPLEVRNDLSFAGNVLWLINGEVPSDTAIRAMDVSLILYAEHEFNASTFASRVVVSTLSDLHSAIAAAIGALKGALHGGANERVLDVLQQVGSPEAAEAWVTEALASKTRIMGFGHRVYKQGDPRARYLSALCKELLTHDFADRPEFQQLEQTADVIESAVVGAKRLPPNLDWPSARLYHYLGLPVELYTPLFVLSRVVGWSAHVIEQLDNNRLIRPRSRYTGPAKREI